MEFVEPIRDRKKIDAIKKVLRGSSLRDYVLFTLGINSGLRVSDLLKLQVSDVLDEKGRVKDRITIREKKTGKAKTFPFSDTVIKALKEYLLEARPQAVLFPSRKGGGPISRQQATAQTPTSSPNIWLTRGAVTKSPASPSAGRVA